MLSVLRKGFQSAGGEIVHTEILNDQPGFYAGYYGTENLLNHTQNADMIYYMHDAMAIGGLAWCQRKGIAVPKRNRHCWLGDMKLHRFSHSAWTTTAIPVLQIGKLSAEQMARSLSVMKHRRFCSAGKTYRWRYALKVVLSRALKTLIAAGKPCCLFIVMQHQPRNAGIISGTINHIRQGKSICRVTVILR